jgi:hypothetical protein
MKDVHGVDLSPLLVTILVATSDYNRQDIPANITELFKKYTEMMLGRWDKQKGLAQQIHAPIKDFLLQSLAFSMHQRRKVAIPLAECRALFEEELKSRGHHEDLDVLVNEVIYRSSLLRLVGDHVEFRHLLLQEFFAGRAIPSVDFLKSVVSDRWWTKAVVFYFGENPANTSAIINMISTVSEVAPHKLFTSAAALGLAIQACYLSKTTDKATALRWVIRTLASVKRPFTAEVDKALEKPGPSPWSFITYYVYGRDSVATSLVKEILPGLLSEEKTEPDQQDLAETMIFWCLVGLVETGELKMLDDLLRRYKPADARLLFGLYLGCYCVANLRMTSATQKDVARRISNRLAKNIRPLALQLIEELKTMLLEERKGEIKALPHPTPKEILDDADGEDDA